MIKTKPFLKEIYIEGFCKLLINGDLPNPGPILTILFILLNEKS
jgi:hypothetical protein